MTIRVVCKSCSAKLKIKDELGGHTGKCPSCASSIEIPLPTQKADSQPDLPPIPFDSLDEDDAPSPPIVLPRNREELGTVVPDSPSSQGGASQGSASQGSSTQSPDMDTGSIAAGDIVVAGESGIHATGRSGIISKGGSSALSSNGSGIHASGIGPTHLGALNHYLICDHKDVVARWDNDGKGWMIRLKDGFTRAATVSTEIPSFGNFVLIEVGVERRSDGLHLSQIIGFQLEPTYALHKLTKGDDVVLNTIQSSATLNQRQITHVKSLVKTNFLPHIWPEMDALLN